LVGLPGLEPGTSSLSEMDGRPPCYSAFPLVVLLRKSYKDGGESLAASPLCGLTARVVWSPARAARNPTATGETMISARLGDRPEAEHTRGG
jgi:hypothetical protein